MPLFPFGYGLSYTTFKFANLKVNQAMIGARAMTVMATATFDVTNTGGRKGAEVAQLYVTEDKPKVPRPMHELKGFERVELATGRDEACVDSAGYAFVCVLGCGCGQVGDWVGEIYGECGGFGGGFAVDGGGEGGAVRVWLRLEVRTRLQAKFTVRPEPDQFEALVVRQPVDEEQVGLEVAIAMVFPVA